MVDIISARVNDETRRRMKRLPHINWSEVIREAITDRLKREERREVDPSDLREAAKITDALRAPSPGWDSTEEIRRWRERR
jgi:Arc/MetJ-type ribon-helix-helix transcriptional regulator